MYQKFLGFLKMIKAMHASVAITALLLVSMPAMANGETRPAQIDTSKPHDQVYPKTAQVSGEQGDIYLKIYVHANGKADRVTIAKSSGFPDLDNAAIESALNWHYLPATQNGDTTSDWMMVRIVYQLPAGQVQQAGQ